MNIITQTILNSIGAVNTAPTIIAHFIDGREATYTRKLYNLMKTDNNVEYILDGITGEVIYEQEA